MKIAENLKCIKENLQISYREMSNITGIPYSTLNKLINGRMTNPNIGILVKIKLAFNISIDEIVLCDCTNQIDLINCKCSKINIHNAIIINPNIKASLEHEHGHDVHVKKEGDENGKS